MIQQVTVLAAGPEDLSSIPGTQDGQKERTNSYKLSSDLHTYIVTWTHTCVYIYTYTHTLNTFNKNILCCVWKSFKPKIIYTNYKDLVSDWKSIQHESMNRNLEKN